MVGDVPGIDVGTPVIGRLVYDASSTSPFPVLDFFLSAGDIDFTIDDVLSASVVEFLGTAGFSAGADLKGRPGLGDWSELVAFQIFREFGESNLFLSAGDGSADAFGHVALSFEAASPIPEPSSLVLLVNALCVALGARMSRVVRTDWASRRRGRVLLLPAKGQLLVADVLCRALASVDGRRHSVAHWPQPFVSSLGRGTSDQR